jgi:Isochorismatase family
MGEGDARLGLQPRLAAVESTHDEICLTFATVQALKDGYDVMFVTDAVGGRSQIAHRTGIERLSAFTTTALARALWGLPSDHLRVARLGEGIVVRVAGGG